MSEKTNAIIAEIRTVICGKDIVILQALAGILSGGHVLIEDVPGVGKTTMALAFSRAMGLDYGRVHVRAHESIQGRGRTGCKLLCSHGGD